MPIISDRLGPNPLHRMRNRIAAEILEDQWKVNYRVNKKYLTRRNCVKLCDLTNFDDEKIAVIIGAGPSLRRNLEDLKALPMDRCDLFCTDKAFPLTQEHHEVKYVTALNAKSPNQEVCGWWKKSFTRKSTLIMPITTDPVTLEDWNGDFCLINCGLPIDLTDTIFNETQIPAIPCGSNVGVLSYMVAARLGYKTCVLVGMDYSFEAREQVLKRYAPGEPYIIFEHRDQQGNVRWSSWDWFDSAVAFFEYARFFKRNGVRTINCTEGGIVHDGEYIQSMTLRDLGIELKEKSP